MDEFIVFIGYVIIAPFWIMWKAIQATFFVVTEVKDKVELYQIDKAQAARKAEQDKKTHDMYATWKCAQCDNVVGQNYVQGSLEHIRTTGRMFCSQKCHEERMASAEPYATMPAYERMASSLSKLDTDLLIGKSSGGMYFEPGRCVECGQVLDDKAAQFAFCSDACKEKAIKPFLQKLDPIDDDWRYQELERNYTKVMEGSDSDLKEWGKELGRKVDREEERLSLHKQIKVLAARRKQELIDAKGEALRTFQEKWEKQRDYILKREQQKVKEQEDKVREKERAETQKILDKANAAVAEREAAAKAVAPRPVPEAARLESTLIVAGAGWGKTQLLQSIIATDLQKPDPPTYIILDSTGAMVDNIQRLQVFEEKLSDRILIIDPAQSPALNMLDFSAPRYAQYSPEQLEDIEAEITSLFNYIFASEDYDLSGQMGTAFGYAIKLMMSRKGSTILDLTRLLEEKPRSWQQSAFKDDIAGLNYGQDFFEHHFFSDSLIATRASISRRIHNLLKTPAFRRMFGVVSNKLDLFEEMNKGTTILVNTNVNLLKEDGMAMFGRYIIGRALAAAFERSSIPLAKRRPTYLVIDEAAPYFDETFEKLFTRARQFRLANIVAFQHLLQASERLSSALTSSTRVKYAAALSAPDRRRMAQDMETTPEFIASMKKDLTDPPQWAQFACYVRPDFDTACIQTIPFFQIEQMSKMSDEAHARLVARNKARLSALATPTPSPHVAPPVNSEAAGNW